MKSISFIIPCAAAFLAMSLLQTLGAVVLFPDEEARKISID